ncbi:MAG: restriction endonuclease [Candidatus Hadarchaeales archaeon]
MGTAVVSQKKRGTNFEYRVAYLFEEFGFEWDRAGSSLGIDLKIYKNGKLRYLVSCKKTSRLVPIYVAKDEIRMLEKKAKEMGAEAIVCFGFRRTPVLALKTKEIKRLPKSRMYYRIDPDVGRPLREILEEESD